MRKNKSKIAEIAFTGEEPKFEGPINRIELAQSLNWYNYFYTLRETKQWILDYMKQFGYTQKQISVYKSSNSKKITQTHASIARLLTNGARFDNTLDEHIKSIISEKTCKDTTQKTYTVPKEINNNLIADLDDCLDNFYKSNYRRLQETNEIVQNCKKTEINEAIRYYQEIFDFVKKYPEYYENITKRQYNKYIEQLNNVLQSLNVTKIVEKRTRKPRKKKPLSKKKVVEKLKFLAKSDEYNVSSFDSSKILEAKIIWTFDEKTRQLTKYVAKESGFVIRGTTIYDYDEENSYMIKLRKPKEVLPDMITGGKRKIEQIVKTLTTKPTNKMNGRTTTTTILLRYFK